MRYAGLAPGYLERVHQVDYLITPAATASYSAHPQGKRASPSPATLSAKLTQPRNENVISGYPTIVFPGMQTPTISRSDFEQAPHLLHAALDRHAAATPDGLAILNATRGTSLTWSALRDRSLAFTAGLRRLGLGRGEFLAASLPLSDDHIALEYACFRLGIVHTPLDLRLGPGEIVRCLRLIQPRAYVALPAIDVPSDLVEHRITDLTTLLGSPEPVPATVTPGDAAQAIFTTGSTGSPKPALLSHRGIACQNLCLAAAFGFAPGQRVLCNLPASHVGGQAELLLTTLFIGATAVTLEVFDPVKSLDAIERHGVTLIGQIPAMFQMEWRTAGYESRNLAGLRAAVYGGQSVPRAFLDRMLTMAPTIGTGLGLTEASGFCTYTPLSPHPDAVANSLGRAMPVYPMSIRGPMTSPGGGAGAALEPGAIGHVCFRGPQNFLGYAGDPDATARALSAEGWLYTGDMGFADEHGNLHFSGRAKWVLKPAGYQVFPGDVEAHISRLGDPVASVGVVGHEHRLWTEGIIAFVEKRAGAALDEAALRRHARSLTSYMRPLHYVVLEPGAMPLNRTAKVDIVRLQELARDEVARLRERGRWDAQ